MAAVVESDDKIGQKLAPFNPSHASVVETALRLLALGAHDTFYDLGCGDGRLLVAASERCGTFLEDIGTTDVASMTEEQWLDFLAHCYTTICESVAAEIELLNDVPF